jgi:lipoprotein-anchoring transpeptidase ErfK/SrfK
MFRNLSAALLVSASFLCARIDSAAAIDTSVPEPTVIYANQPQPVRTASAERSRMGGGFIEFLFGGGADRGQPYPQEGLYQQQPSYYQQQPYGGQQQIQQDAAADPRQRAVDPRFAKQDVAYDGREGVGTVVIDTPNKFLYLVEGNGRALRYGIGVGRPGFTWSGVKTISAKREWPDWTPPAEMLARRPDLPRHMEGGPENPLGARAMYLGSTLYRIHGSNEPWTIGTNVSSGCIRMRNEDVIDLYGRVNVGTKVVVL